MKNIQHLRSLKAPGDPAYDTIRRFAYAEAMGPRGGIADKEKAANDRSHHPTAGPSERSEEDGEEDAGSAEEQSGAEREPTSPSVSASSRSRSRSGSSPASDGIGGGASSPSIATGGGRVSKWAEMIYAADGYHAGWNQVVLNLEDPVPIPQP